MRLIFHKFRYKKQRGYADSNTIVVKFLPIPFAVIMANIILRVKPVEAEFARLEFNTDLLTTKSFLYTIYGVPVDPLKMASILAYDSESG